MDKFISISRNDARVLDILFRNPYEHYTMRHIAKLLKMSAGGAHKILKQLEADKVVVPEKMGTGIFYSLDLGSKVVRNLMAFILTQHEVDERKYVKIVEHPNVRAVLVTSQKVLVLCSGTILPGPEFGTVVVVLTVEEFYQNLLKRDKETLAFLREAAVVHGEQVIIHEMKKIKGYF